MEFSCLGTCVQFLNFRSSINELMFRISLTELIVSLLVVIVFSVLWTSYSDISWVHINVGEEAGNASSVPCVL